jgi:hypothetical protein
MVVYWHKNVHRTAGPGGNAADMFSTVFGLNIDKVNDYTDSLFVEGSRRIYSCA